ncbi:hypothetical protein [Rhodovastum atsumiense]|uniref:Uncharacterized protein n=1 Tax=Rhodovastum atsumiense TaxID=504468 RepID=A0A5M6IKS5_9PROT|nr:hypothetical protein [Rhodovastum atsumiense]KAA5608782.1 hypothetical protein F1189_27460 [Rhodovastum atsumiense]
MAGPDVSIGAELGRQAGGNGGNIAIEALQENVTGNLMELSSRFLQAPVLQRQGCGVPMAAEKAGSLVSGGIGGLPRDGEGPQRGRYFGTASPVVPAGTGVTVHLAADARPGGTCRQDGGP